MTDPLPARALPDRATMVVSLRLFRERGWARTLLGVLALSAVFLLLGRWQWHRYQAASTRSDRIGTHYSHAPVPLTQILPTTSDALAAGLEWRAVAVSGSYQPARTVLVRNRPLDGVYGYEVLVPLRLDDGTVLVVDRGWIPNGRTGARPDTVPAPPTGTVRVVARLRPGEPPVGRTPPPGQALRIDLDRISAGLGAPSFRAYGVLASETPAPADAPTPLPRPSVSLGPHLSYAVQWVGFAVATWVMLGYYAVREARRRTELAAGPAPGRAAARRRARLREPEEDEEL